MLSKQCETKDELCSKSLNLHSFRLDSPDI